MVYSGGQAASRLRGDTNDLRQNEIPLKACKIVLCTFEYPEWPSIWSDPCIHAILWDQEIIHSDKYHKNTLRRMLSNSYCPLQDRRMDTDAFVCLGRC